MAINSATGLAPTKASSRSVALNNQQQTLQVFMDDALEWSKYEKQKKYHYAEICEGMVPSNGDLKKKRS